MIYYRIKNLIQEKFNELINFFDISLFYSCVRQKIVVKISFDQHSIRLILINLFVDFDQIQSKILIKKTFR